MALVVLAISILYYLYKYTFRESSFVLKTCNQYFRGEVKMVFNNFVAESKSENNFRILSTTRFLVFLLDNNFIITYKL